MSDSTRKIKITSDNDEGQEEASEKVARDYDDDDEKEREPINLDFQGGLADALAAATRIRKPAAEASSRAAASYAANEGNGRAEAQASSSVVIDAVPEVENSTEAPAVEPRVVTDAVVLAENERLKAEAKQANENYLRALADLQNFRRRGEEERLRILKDGNEKLIKEFLPVLDDFDLAVAHAKQVESYEQLIGGVEAILRKFRETLSKAGVEAIEAIGEKFDPDMHEAVMVEEDSDQPDETVTSELRKGYTLHKRVIRPSLVKVAKS